MTSRKDVPTYQVFVINTSPH